MNWEGQHLRRGDIVILKPGTVRGRFRLTTPTIHDTWLAVNIQTAKPCRIPISIIDRIDPR